MNKLLNSVLALTVAFGLSACSQGQSAATETTASSEATQTANNDRNESEEKNQFLKTLKSDGYAELGSYKVEKLDDNVYHMDEGIKALPGGATDSYGQMNNPSSIYFMEFQNDLLVIDGGNKPDEGSSKEIDAKTILDSMADGKNVTFAFTHGHGDHIGLLWNKNITSDIKIKNIYFCKNDDINDDTMGIFGASALKGKS